MAYVWRIKQIKEYETYKTFGAASISNSSFNQTALMSNEDIKTVCHGFFVLHNPLQAITTTDPTTYVLLGVFARN